MKKHINPLALVSLLLMVLSCTANNPYDNSTPEKFIQSLGQVGLQPKEQNPIPYFYAAVDAKAITRFDETGRKCINAFEAFKKALNEHFPDRIVRERKTEIKLKTDNMGMSTNSFSLSASLIRDQLQARLPEDYEFLSATEPDEQGVIKVSCKISGSERTIPVKLENNQYLMFLTEGSHARFDKMVEFFTQAEEFFILGERMLISEDINTENFETKITTLETQYFDLLAKLN